MLPTCRNARLLQPLWHPSSILHSRRRMNYANTHPNRPLELDPSLQALLRDVDISLRESKAKQTPFRRELDVFPLGGPELDKELVPDLEPPEADYRGRKSPAAQFGSLRVGSVVLPLELENSINALISAEFDKQLLRRDAQELFHSGRSGDESEWKNEFTERRGPWERREFHKARDSAAFASVALPAHYSAIVAVLKHLSDRLGPTWSINRVLDWGSATGSGLWAALQSFQQHSKNKPASDPQELTFEHSSIESYIGIDKRTGLTSLAKRIADRMKSINCILTWKKSFRDEDRVPVFQGQNTLALAAFFLTSLPTSQARRTAVQQMWESGANTMVILDHGTEEGFEVVAQAREQLIELGQNESEDLATSDSSIRGCHVIAPCPHDDACPLYRSNSKGLICSFSQRLQRPSFVRYTKRSGQGYEDIKYSYVVIQRGKRPLRAVHKLGRVGDVGKREREKVAQTPPIRELMLEDNCVENEEHAQRNDKTVISSHEAPMIQDSVTGPALESSLRVEAYSWPRLVFSPIKKSGHIILDGCTREGKIMRITIPKSQGKQEFYDARKSAWGDIFPHQPKNPPQERYAPNMAPTNKSRGVSDIGKIKKTKRSKDRLSYDSLTTILDESKKRERKARRGAASLKDNL